MGDSETPQHFRNGKQQNTQVQLTLDNTAWQQRDTWLCDKQGDGQAVRAGRPGV